MPLRLTWSFRAGLIALVVGAAGWVALPADAATNGTVAVVQSNVIQYPAANDKANTVVLTRSGRTVTVDDTVAINAGAGCARVAGDSTKVRCTTKSNPIWVRVYLRDRNDSVVNNTDLPMTAEGGTGKDRITGGPKNDNLSGGDGADTIWGRGGGDSLGGEAGTDTLHGGDGSDRLDGGEDADHMYGGSGNDTFDDWGRFAGSNADTFSGGPGLDWVVYVGRAGAVTADADGVAGDDGERGERDSIGTDVEGIQGGQGNDRLIGTNRADFLAGGDGDDVLTGGGGNDSLAGERGRDRLDGGAGNDILVGDDPQWGKPVADTLVGGSGTDAADYSNYTRPLTIDLDGAVGDDGEAGEHDTVGADVEDVRGGSGNDRITGNARVNALSGWAGNDTLIGLAGNDTLTGMDGKDTLSAGAGADYLDGIDRDADRMDAGADRDVCDRDVIDVLASCEEVRPS